jgi:hypothetical protein
LLNTMVSGFLTSSGHVAELEGKMRMRGFKLLLAAAALATASIGTASAIPISGSLSITGINSYNSTTNQITFFAGFTIVGTGDYAPFVVPGLPVTMRNTGTAISYNAQDLTAGSDLSCGAGCVFTAFLLGGNTAQFNLTSYTVTEGTNTLGITGFGIAFLSGFDPTPGTFSYSTQQEDAGLVSFSATDVSPVPGPVVGAGLPALLMACGGLLALARRRRSAIAA